MFKKREIQIYVLHTIVFKDNRFRFRIDIVKSTGKIQFNLLLYENA